MSLMLPDMFRKNCQIFRLHQLVVVDEILVAVRGEVLVGEYVEMCLGIPYFLELRILTNYI
jgi:hypothetical protein